jgi:hypothetical protein
MTSSWSSLNSPKSTYKYDAILTHIKITIDNLLDEVAKFLVPEDPKTQRKTRVHPKRRKQQTKNQKENNKRKNQKLQSKPLLLVDHCHDNENAQDQ